MAFSLDFIGYYRLSEGKVLHKGAWVEALLGMSRTIKKVEFPLLTCKSLAGKGVKRFEIGFLNPFFITR